MKKQLYIRKTEPSRCAECQSTDIEYTVTYNDPDRPGHTHYDKKLQREIHFPTRTLYACKHHLAHVSMKVFALESLVPTLDDMCSEYVNRGSDA